MAKRVIVLLALWLLLAVGAQAQTGLTMTAEPAYGGRFKYGQWLPVFVTIENNGPALQAEVRLEVSGRSGELEFSAPAELAAGAHKRIILYTLPNNFSRAIRVELVAGDEIVAERTVRVSVLPNDRYVIGLITTGSAKINLLSSIELPGRRHNPETFTLPLSHIPDRAEGLALFNTLILNDVDTARLSPGQQRALTGWTLNGGRLIVGGGAAAVRTLSGLPPQLQPVSLSGQQEVTSLTALAEYAGESIPQAGPFLLAESQPVSAANILLAHETGPPLLVEMEAGTGFVDFIALDLNQAPFNNWTGLIPFAEKILSPGAAWPNQLPTDVEPALIQDSTMASALNNLPALDLPSIRFLGILLAGYIILVGPVNYLILRWQDRMTWAWLTIPALTVAFSGVAYGIGFQLRGSDIIVNQVSLIELSDSGRPADMRTYVGLFSPRRQSYNVAVGGEGLIRPLGEGYYDPWQSNIEVGSMRVVQGDPARVRGLTVNKWSMQSFVVESTPAADLPRISARLQAGFDSLAGQLENQSDYILRDVIVIFQRQFQKLGDLSPGQSVEIKLNFEEQAWMKGGFGSYMLFQDELSGPGPRNRRIQFKQQVLDSTIFNYNTGDPKISHSVYLVAWLDESPLPVSVEEREIAYQQSTLLYGQLPVSFAEGSIPPGFSRAEMLASSGDSGPCYTPGSDSYHLYQGTVELEISLPDKTRNLRPARLDLYISTDGGWQEPPEISLYDWTSGEWEILEEARFGANPVADRFYNRAEAAVRLRASQENPGLGGGCLFFELAFAGESP